MMRSERSGSMRRLALLVGLAFLLAAAALVWTQRLASFTEADESKKYEKWVSDLDQKLRAQHGDVCGEMISLLPDGEAKPHGLAPDTELPMAAVGVLTEKARIGLDAFEHKSVGGSDVSLISEDRTSEVLSGGREVLGKAIRAMYLTGGGKGVDRWQVTDIAHFYACSPAT